MSSTKIQPIKLVWKETYETLGKENIENKIFDEKLNFNRYNLFEMRVLSQNLYS